MLLYERTKCEALHQEILFSGFVIYKPALFYMKMMRLLTKATRMASDRGICCLSSVSARWDFGQRQLDWPPFGISAAFGTFDQDWVFSRGNQMGPQPANVLPLAHSSKIGSSAKATNMASIRHICCL